MSAGALLWIEECGHCGGSEKPWKADNLQTCSWLKSTSSHCEKIVKICAIRNKKNVGFHANFAETHFHRLTHDLYSLDFYGNWTTTWWYPMSRFNSQINLNCCHLFDYIAFVSFLFYFRSFAFHFAWFILRGRQLSHFFLPADFIQQQRESPSYYVIQHNLLRFTIISISNAYTPQITFYTKWWKVIWRPHPPPFQTKWKVPIYSKNTTDLTSKQQ